jgi:hypothetical protein
MRVPWVSCSPVLVLCVAQICTASDSPAAPYVQGSMEACSDQAEIAATFPSWQVAGDLNVVFVTILDSNAAVTSVVDSRANLYQRVGSIARPDAAQFVYVATNIISAYARANTVRVDFSAVVPRATVAVAEYHGVKLTPTLDRSLSSTGVGQALRTTLPVVTTSSELVLVAASGGGKMLAPGPFYTQRLIDPARRSLLADRITNAVGSYETAATQQHDAWYLVQVLGFQIADHGATLRPPYPVSALTRELHWNFSTLLSHRKAIGSDIWPMTWGPDGNIYTAWGDGGGFDGTELSKRTGRVSLGFARISGFPDPADASTFEGKNLWGAPKYAQRRATFGGKVTDLISVAGVLYAQGGFWTHENCTCGDPSQRSEANAVTRSLAWSKDLGKTWHYASWTNPNDLGSTLQFGPDYSGARDPAHVYFYFQGDIYADPTHVYLRRLAVDDLTKDLGGLGLFEYFTFADQTAQAHWSRVPGEARPIFYDPNIAAQTYVTATVVYDAPLQRYLLALMHGPSMGQVGFFEARDPWGPWRTLGYYDDWQGLNETAGEATGLSIPTKWISVDGRAFWTVFSGVNNGGANEFDSLNLVRASLD